MRGRLLGVAEVLGWIAASFTIFLGLRVFSIALNLVDPAQCNESCDLGNQLIPVVLMTFGLGWFPFVLVHFVRLAKRGEASWFIVHTVVVVASHAAAMVVIIRIFAEFGDADTRTSILAACTAFFDVLTGALLVFGALLTRVAVAEEHTAS